MDRHSQLDTYIKLFRAWRPHDFEPMVRPLQTLPTCSLSTPLHRSRQRPFDKILAGSSHTT